MSAGIAAVQARIGALHQLVSGTPVVRTAAPSTTTASSTGSFDAALAVASAPATTPTTLTTLTGTTSTGTGTSGTATGQDLVAAATRYLGVPYVWGGESLDEGGLDCSGLVQRALADLGVTDVPRVAREQMTLGTAVPSLDQALPGDLVVFGGGSHIGIYAGDGRMIDAPKPGKPVTVRDVYEEPTAIRRILPQAGATTTTDAVSAVASAQRAALAALVGLGASGTGAAA